MALPDRYRLAAVTAWPVQYQAPLFRQLAADGRVDLTVFYGNDAGAAGYFDPQFGRTIAWDRPLLEGYRSVILRRCADSLNAWQRLRAEAAVIGHLWRGRFDAVFIHSYATRLSLLAYAGALASRTPVLLRTESERLRPRRRWIETLKQIVLRPLFAATSAFLVIGESNRQFFDTYGVSRTRHFFTPYSVDNTYFAEQRRQLAPRRHELRRHHGWTDETVVIGFSGKLIPLKRVGDLLDAVAALQRDGLAVGLLVVGDGACRARLEQRVRDEQITGAVFTGFQNQTEIPASYAAMDVLVLPSRSETWGLVLNEAMLFGLPVLATTRVGAAQDLVEDGRNGFLYEVGDVAALTDALRGLVRSRPMRVTFGARSEERIQQYSLDQCVRGILAALHSVTRRATRHTAPSSAGA